MKARVSRLAARRMGAVVLLLIGVACARMSNASTDDSPNLAYDESPVALLVENHNFSDMNVYAMPSSGALFRLGTVTGESSGTFKIPSSYIQAGAIGFRAIPIGGFGQAGTGRVMVSPGDTLVWMIEQSLRQSSITIR